jgi:hypothetical protein
MEFLNEKRLNKNDRQLTGKCLDAIIMFTQEVLQIFRQRQV